MSISRIDHDVGVQKVGHRWSDIDAKTDWDSAKILGQRGHLFMRITKTLKDKNKNQPSSDTDGDVVMEDDAEALEKDATPGIQVTYDILHSSTYQVPVLYITFKDRRPPPDEVYELLVPDAHKSPMKSVGVMGALSLTDNPLNDLPAYFVHPCRTQDAMDPLVRGRKVGCVEYILLWLGMIGGSVGLNVPVELVQALGYGQKEVDRS